MRSEASLVQVAWEAEVVGKVEVFSIKLLYDRCFFLNDGRGIVVDVVRFAPSMTKSVTVQSGQLQPRTSSCQPLLRVLSSILSHNPQAPILPRPYQLLPRPVLLSTPTTLSILSHHVLSTPTTTLDTYPISGTPTPQRDPSNCPRPFGIASDSECPASGRCPFSQPFAHTSCVSPRVSANRRPSTRASPPDAPAAPLETTTFRNAPCTALGCSASRSLRTRRMGRRSTRATPTLPH